MNAQPETYPDLSSERLHLVWVRPELLRALITGPEEFTALTGWPVAEAYMDFPGALEFSLDQWETGAADARYWMYLIVLLGHPDRVVGMIGHKGGPTEKNRGQVEIGYSVAPEFQGRGIATEATALLVQRALAAVEVNAVVACTLAERNASCRVLEKNGFSFVKEIVDPEEGSIWEWRRER